MMNEEKTVTITISNNLTNELIEKIAYAKYAKSLPAYADNLRYMMFCDKYETDCFHVVATNGNEKVCGYLYCIQNNTNPKLWYYGDLFVIKEMRRLGIACQMVRAAMAHLSDIGATSLRVFVDRGNVPSQKLQYSLGFTEKTYEKFNDIDNEGQIMFEKTIQVPMSFISATVNEARYIMALYTENKHALHGERISYSNFQDQLSLKNEDETNLLFFKGAMPVAWLKINGLLNKSTAWISMLVVHNKFRRQGIGKYAIEYTEELVKREGFTTVKIHTTEDNNAALKFYSSMGYEIIEKEFVLFGDDVNGMQLTLSKTIE